jgi:threonine/homoserine/homoserine lactone efflux protein
MPSFARCIGGVERLLSLAAYCFASSVTPGPNNLMLMASGANFGVRRSLPHALGISLGFSFMVVVTGAGLGRAFIALPWLQAVLKVVGFAYLCWLAWRIATAAGIGGGEARGRPMTFLQAAAFQWVNIKAWMMILGSVSIYLDPARDLAGEIALLAVTFAAIGFPCMMAWLWAGVAIRRLLSRPGALRAFNIAMAVLLVGSAVPMLL